MSALYEHLADLWWRVRAWLAVVAMTPEREAEIRDQSPISTCRASISSYVLPGRISETSSPALDAARQQVADLQAIIGKQEEELHQASLETTALRMELDKAAQNYERMGIDAAHWEELANTPLMVDVMHERDEARELLTEFAPPGTGLDHQSVGEWPRGCRICRARKFLARTEPKEGGDGR